MIELKRDQLVISFPEVHPLAELTISFQRTLRIPDDDQCYSLPPGLGSFPLRHVDDMASSVPASWLKHGGVMFPMYQSEAMWICFNTFNFLREATYPFAIKIAAGKINAVSGKKWSKGLHRRPRQDYVVAPDQPWLDGYCVEEGVIRQFVAMPMGAGYTAEEQITGKAEHGGLQLEVFPMKAEAFERRFLQKPEDEDPKFSMHDSYVSYCRPPDMGLAPGGRMKQNIEMDPYDNDDWDLEHVSRCFVHIANSMVWRQITGENPPTTPPTAKEYTEAGLPWFDWYDDNSKPLKGSKKLAGLKSVHQMGKEKKQKPLPENQSVKPKNIVPLHPEKKTNRVREFEESPVLDH